MKVSIRKSLLAILLALLLLTSGSTLVFALSAGANRAPAAQESAPAVEEAAAPVQEEAPAAPAIADVTSKEEVVYATLGANGAVKQAYVVNIFNVATEGSILDYGDYASVLNLTNTETIERTGITSRVRADAGRFYYQGNLNARLLPWNFTITYTLDGTPVAAENVGGQTGRLEIRLASQKNEAIDPMFYDNYMLQISVTLDAQLCTNLSIPGATAANAGGDKMLTYTCMPGKDCEIVLGADVVNFSMGGISINAVPLSIQIDAPDTTELTGQLTQLTDAITQINDGATQLTGGLEQLKDGTDQLASGSKSYKSGINKLANSSSQLVDGSQQFLDGLKKITGAIGNVDVGDINVNTAELARELRSLASTMNRAADDLAVIMPNSSTVTELRSIASKMNSAAKLLESADTDDISGALSSLKSTVKKAVDGYTELHNGIVSYTDGVKKLSRGYSSLNSGISSVADGVTGLYDGATQLSDGTNQLATETSGMDTKVSDTITDMLAEYDRSDFVPASFVSIQNKSVSAVQFVLKTEDIVSPAAPAAETEAVSEETFWDRLLHLFGA